MAKSKDKLVDDFITRGGRIKKFAPGVHSGRYSLAIARSLADPGGAYNADGEYIGRVHCGCEDYPCCGH